MEVYITNAAALAGREEELLPLLPEARREKLLRLKNAPDRLRSLAGGLLLRRFLEEAPLLLTPEGKPYIPGGPFFNLSHSGDWAALALSDAELGADVEKPGPLREGVARRICTAEEAAYLRTDGDDRFIYLWTRKEAVLKCLGCGLGRAMNDFSVLAESVCVDGRTLFLRSACVEGYWLSVASPREESWTPRRLTPGELIDCPME